ncbi:MAG: hypothetical protein HRK26_02580 [Rickettsiaceae bacterium H1]|nr:hypothetical protein [Rickettsiaceae bacterium H1]
MHHSQINDEIKDFLTIAYLMVPAIREDKEIVRHVDQEFRDFDQGKLKQYLCGDRFRKYDLSKDDIEWIKNNYAPNPFLNPGIAPYLVFTIGSYADEREKDYLTKDQLKEVIECVLQKIILGLTLGTEQKKSLNKTQKGLYDALLKPTIDGESACTFLAHNEEYNVFRSSDGQFLPVNQRYSNGDFENDPALQRLVYDNVNRKKNIGEKAKNEIKQAYKIFLLLLKRKLSSDKEIDWDKILLKEFFDEQMKAMALRAIDCSPFIKNLYNGKIIDIETLCDVLDSVVDNEFEKRTMKQLITIYGQSKINPTGELTEEVIVKTKKKPKPDAMNEYLENSQGIQNPTETEEITTGTETENLGENFIETKENPIPTETENLDKNFTKKKANILLAVNILIPAALITSVALLSGLIKSGNLKWKIPVTVAACMVIALIGSTFYLHYTSIELEQANSQGLNTGYLR